MTPQILKNSSLAAYVGEKQITINLEKISYPPCFSHDGKSPKLSTYAYPDSIPLSDSRAVIV